MTCAVLLHEEAHVPPGPCGYEELTKFSKAPSLYNYQIVLVDADRAYHVKSFERPLSKELILLHEKGHYDVITSLPGSFLELWLRVCHLLQILQYQGRSPMHKEN